MNSKLYLFRFFTEHPQEYTEIVIVVAVNAVFREKVPALENCFYVVYLFNEKRQKERGK